MSGIVTGHRGVRGNIVHRAEAAGPFVSRGRRVKSRVGRGPGARMLSKFKFENDADSGRGFARAGRERPG
jgi:hypothetical protein